MVTPTVPPSDKIDWDNIGFQYRDINGYTKYTWTPENGWDQGSFETNPYLNVHMCATGINYGQEVSVVTFLLLMKVITNLFLVL
jgi:branched-chain amino acid aminotransferase